MFESKINRGKANGYAPLDSEGKVPLDKTYVGANGTSGTSGISGTSGVNGSQGSNGVSGTSGIDGTSGTSGIDGTNGTDGVDGTSGSSGTSGTSGTSALVNTNLIFTDNTIEGDYINPAGTKITIATNKDGGVNLNGNGILVTNTSPNNEVQVGWIVRFYDGTVREVIVSTLNIAEGYWIIQIDENVNLSPAYPLTIESPDYQLGDVPYLELKVSGSSVLIDSDGVTSFPNNIIVTGSINGASNLATTGSNTFIGDQTITGSLNIAGVGDDEGGEIQLGLAQTNTTLSGSIVFDVYRDKLRLFEGGGNNRGAFLNVASQSNSVSSEIVTSNTIQKIETISSASYAALTPPVSGTLYIII